MDQNSLSSHKPDFSSIPNEWTMKYLHKMSLFAVFEAKRQTAKYYCESDGIVYKKYIYINGPKFPKTRLRFKYSDKRQSCIFHFILLFVRFVLQLPNPFPGNQLDIILVKIIYSEKIFVKVFISQQ